MSEPSGFSGVVVSSLTNDHEMKDLIELFVDELPQRVEAMRKAIEETDLGRLAQLSHQLKGSAGGYGFQCITESARRLENEARSRADVETLNRSFRELSDLCNRARA